jgi:hypothetical protein
MKPLTVAQLRALLAPSLSIAATIAAITPTPVDDSVVVAINRLSQNDIAMALVVNLVNRLIQSIDPISGQPAPELCAQLEAALAAA